MADSMMDHGLRFSSLKEYLLPHGGWMNLFVARNIRVTAVFLLFIKGNTATGVQFLGDIR